MGGLNDAIIQGFRLGQDIKSRREEQEQRAQDRKLERDVLSQRIRQLKIDEQMELRKARESQAGNLQGKQDEGGLNIANVLRSMAVPGVSDPDTGQEMQPGYDIPIQTKQGVEQDALRRLMQGIGIKQKEREVLPEFSSGTAGVFNKFTGEVTSPAAEKKESQPSSVQEYLYYATEEMKAGKKPLSFDEYQTRDANRKAPRTTIINQAGKLLTPQEAALLGVPYGTTREDASGALPANETQRATANYASRLKQSGDIINGIEGAITSMGFIGQTYEQYAPNLLKTTEGRRFMQAKRNFINSVLRRESGAVISPSEFEEGDKQYFPQPGDDPETLAQKKANRETVIQNFIKSSGNAYIDPGTLSAPNVSKQPSAKVKMKAPTGEVQEVSADQVEHYKSLGATVVK